MKGRRWWMTVGIVWTMALLFALAVIVPGMTHAENGAIQERRVWAGEMVSTPNPAPQCRITGLVYAAEDLSQVDAQDVKVPFHCPITVERFERRLVLTSPTWYVEIEIPRNGGWMAFAYTWGGDTAYIGPRAIKIINGPKEQG